MPPNLGEVLSLGLQNRCDRPAPGLLDLARAGGPADLLVDGLSIEVKAARLAPYRSDGRRGFQFCLRRNGHTDARRAAVVVLLAYWDVASDPVAFVIPSEAVGDRCKVVIPNRQPWLYGGRWARFYQRWELLADLLGEV